MNNYPILLVDDDPVDQIVNFMLDLEKFLDVEIELEQDFENVLEKLDEMKDDLKVIILDIMARKYETLYGKSTHQGYNTGLVLLDAIEEKLLAENWRDKISIIVRSARQEKDLKKKYFEGKSVKFFTRDQNSENDS
jgi:CheY-like chemotaxis protein